MSAGVSDIEVFKHPNFRVVSAFFSGFVFWGSLCHLIQSPFARYIQQRTATRLKTYWARRYRKTGQSLESDQEAQTLTTKDAMLRAMGQKRNSMNESIFRRQDNPTLIFVLTLLFFMAGLSQFLTSLVFDTKLDAQLDSEQSRALCAFLFAWDSMSLQAARLVGLVVLGLNLMSLGVRRAEVVAFWFLIFVVAAMVIVTNALAIGAPMVLNLMGSFVKSERTMIVCQRQHNLASSLVLSLIVIGLEIYSITGFLNIISPPSFPIKRRLDTLFKDIRIVRAFALLLFDVIIIVPNATETNTLGDVLPFSIASLIVLAVFNNYQPSLPLFHEVPPRANNDKDQNASKIVYKPLVIPQHPYALAARGSSQFLSSAVAERTHFTTTSRSDHALLGPGPRSDTYNASNKGFTTTLEAKALPPLPQETQRRVHYARSRSSSRSRSRAGSRRTRASNRSQKSALVRPIVPKAELARQFDDSERTTEWCPIRALDPRPPKKMGSSKSSPIKEPSPVALRPNDSETRRHSASTTAAQTSASVSVRYGSDILRPEPGRVVRDKMRVSSNTRVPSTTSERTGASGRSQESVPPVPVVKLSRSSSYDSWLSDDILDAYLVPDRIPSLEPLPPLPTFSGVWPLPPTSVPVVNDQNAGRLGLKKLGRPGLPSSPAPARLRNASTSSNVDAARNVPEDPERIKSPTRSQISVRRSRPPSVRGPRQHFPPPRTSSTSRIAQR